MKISDNNSRGNAKFTHLKIICIFVKYSLLAAM